MKILGTGGAGYIGTLHLSNSARRGIKSLASTISTEGHREAVSTSSLSKAILATVRRSIAHLQNIGLMRLCTLRRSHSSANPCRSRSSILPRTSLTRQNCFNV